MYHYYNSPPEEMGRRIEALNTLKTPPKRFDSAFECLENNITLLSNLVEPGVFAHNKWHLTNPVIKSDIKCMYNFICDRKYKMNRPLSVLNKYFMKHHIPFNVDYFVIKSNKRELECFIIGIFIYEQGKCQETRCCK